MISKLRDQGSVPEMISITLLDGQAGIRHKETGEINVPI